MGWKLKVLAFLFALVMADFQQWLIVLLLFLYVFSGAIVRAWRKKGPSSSSAAAAATPQTSSAKGRRKVVRLLLNLFGALLLIVAIVASSRGGSLSPLVFGFFGMIMLVWGRLPSLGPLSKMEPVKDSVLFRGSLSIHWAAIAEVKLATEQAARALSAIGERIVIVRSESPSVYVAVEMTAWSYRAAEADILRKLKQIGEVLAPVDAYLLPLDSGKVPEVFMQDAEKLDLDTGDLKRSLFTSSYDVLSVESYNGVAVSAGAYKKVQDESSKVNLYPVRQELAGTPILWEFLRIVEGTIQWPEPDRYTSFLSSMSVTRNQPVGERIKDNGSAASPSETLVLKSLGSPEVELSRPQLRAIVRIYS